MGIKHIGDLKKTNRFLKKVKRVTPLSILERYGQRGVQALSSATPTETGETASAWSYYVSKSKKDYTISWSNSNVVHGVSIVILLQYGHATRSGSFVQGRDFINPAIRPVFDKILQEAWKEVLNI